MAREFMIEAGNDDTFIVISKKLKNNKLIKEDKYKVDLRNVFCTNITEHKPCPAFWFGTPVYDDNHKLIRRDHNCIHIKTILQLLKSKGIGIVWNKQTKSYYTNWDYQDIEKELKERRII